MENICEKLKKKIETICNNNNNSLMGGWITGDGPIPAKILFVGEAPGKNEVLQGKPFVGMAGKKFESYLNKIGLDRKDIRITNTCFFRPIKITIGKNGKESISNRPPKIFEINLFKEVLDMEINAVNPKVIVTLGNVPLKRLTEFKSIGECHGNIYFNKELNRYIFPMYHPSSLTYNRASEFLEKYELDWLKLKRELEKL